MIEPEMAFADLQDDMDNAEAYVKSVVGAALAECPDELEFFAKFYDKTLLEKLQARAIRNAQFGTRNSERASLGAVLGAILGAISDGPSRSCRQGVVDQPFARVRYAEAVTMLQEEIAKDPSKWEFPDVSFGTDLSTEHERWLSETAFGRATFVYDYPKSIKAFYMRDNDDGTTVAAMDLLVPGVGELIGGSQREERLDMLKSKMAAAGLSEADYWWYLDLRRYGTVPHAGYGLGFERLVCYVTGVPNIREASAFPRFPGSCEF